MKKRLLLSFLTTASMIPVFAQGAVESQINFTKAVISEVINDVRIVDAKSLSSKPANKDETFLAPDMLRTGRKSRAQLMMPDGTVVRVGSNAVFSFDAAARTIRLKNGTVIFHSPTGKGGGTIVTNSATASVIGTTIMVTATSNGGFKFSVLEGEGKVSFPDGKESRIKAGQMTFVLPKSDGSSEEGSSEQSQDEEGGGAATQGVVLNFDLATMVSESGLLNGFSSTIASAGKIQSAISEQGSKIAGGDLQQTGMVILNAASSQDFYCADLATVRQQSVSSDYNFVISQNDDMRIAADLQSNLYIDENNRIPERYIFREPVEVDGGGWGFNDFTGVLAKEVTFGNGVVDLGKVDGPSQIGIGAEKIVFDGNIVLSGLNQTEVLVVGGGEIVNTDGASLDVVFGGNGGTVKLVAESTSSLDGMSISNNTGAVVVQVNSGDLIISNSALESQNTISGSNIAGDMTLVSSAGAVEINSSNVTAHDSSLTISGATSVAVNDSTLVAKDVSITGADVSVSGDSVITGDSVAVAANGSVEIDSSHLAANEAGLNISGSAQVSISNSILEGVDTFVSGGVISIANDTRITGDSIVINSDNGLSIAGSNLLATDTLSLNGGSGTVQISQSILNAGQGTVSIGSDTGLVLEGASITGNTVTLVSSQGDFSSSGGTNIIATSGGMINAANISLVDSSLSSQGSFSIQAGNELLLERSSVTARDVSLVSSAGSIELISANIQSANGNVTISAPQDIAVFNSVLGVHQGNLEIVSGGVVTVSSSTIISGGNFKIEGSSVEINGSTSATNIDLRGGTMTVDASAGGLKLDNVSVTSQPPARGMNISLSGDTVEINQSQIQTSQADIVITAGNSMALTGTTITGSSLVLSASPNGGVIALDQVNLNVPMQVINATAETMTLSNVSFSDGTLATLYSGSGLLNVNGVITGSVNFTGNVTYAGDDALKYLYVPELNIGDVESPIHILPFGASDFRGSKLEYSLGNPLAYVTVNGVQQISNNFVYRKVIDFDPSQFGVNIPSELAALDPDFYKFCGVLAQSMTVTSEMMSQVMAVLNDTDFTGFTVPTVKFYAPDLSLGASTAFTVPAFLTHVVVGGDSITVPDGAILNANFSTSDDRDNRFYVRSTRSLTLNNASVNSFHGNLSIQTGADLTMNGGVLSAGCGAPTHPNGHINIDAPLGSVTLNNVDISGKQNASRLNIAANTVQLNNTTMQTPALEAGYIGIQGALSVSIQGSRLVARDVYIGGGSGSGGVRATLENLDVNGVQFGDSTTVTVGANAPTVAMEARTIVIRNVDFMAGSQVTLSSGDGALNVMGSNGSMVGAVNFGSGSVSYGGNDVTSATGISEYVNVAGHGPSNSKIFFDKQQQQGIVTRPDAPIQIKTL